MKAIVYNRFGGTEVLSWSEAPDPVAKPDDVIVAMRTSSINVLDIRSRNGAMFPFVDRKFPKIAGIDVAGVVVSLGANVTAFKPGQAVFGAGNAFKGGAFAELVAVRQTGLALKPAELSFEQAATLPTTGLAALQAIRDLGNVRARQRVLVHGGSGGAGLIAIQLAIQAGAEVTGVSGASGLAAMLAAGAQTALDYRSRPLALEGPYDVILNFSGAFPFGDARRWMAPRGRFIEASPTIPKFLGSLIANPLRAQKHLMLQTVAKTAALEQVGAMVADGSLKATVAGVYPLEAAREAFVRQEKGGVIGKIVLVRNQVAT
jgi:NADPH:quinone reductase-like Zn-dependent oxidoreductase